MPQSTWKIVAAASALALFVLAASASANVWNKKTVVTLGESIEIPGAVLPPGTYVMKLSDSRSNRHVVEFWNEDEDELIATTHAIPNRRLQVEGDTVLKFYDTPADQPEALRAWFYPGDNYGQEFVYPDDRAAEIASFAARNVPTDREGTRMARNARGEEIDLEQAGIENEQQDRRQTVQSTRRSVTSLRVEPRPLETTVAAKPAPAPAPVTRESTPEPAPEPQQEQRASRLPQTASSLPLWAALGTLLLGTGWVIRRLSV